MRASSGSPATSSLTSTWPGVSVGRKVDDAGGNGIQNAALHLRHQGQADIAGVNAAAQRRADWLVAARNKNMSAGECEPGQFIRLMRRNARFDHHAGIIAKGCRQIDAPENFLERSAGYHRTLIEQDQMVGQARHFIRRMADVNDRNRQLAHAGVRGRAGFPVCA